MSLSFDPRASLSCAVCGDRIGVYEPLLLRAVDGSLAPSSYLDLRERAGELSEGASLVHEACATAAEPAGERAA